MCFLPLFYSITRRLQIVFIFLLVGIILALSNLLYYSNLWFELVLKSDKESGLHLQDD